MFVCTSDLMIIDFIDIICLFKLWLSIIWPSVYLIVSQGFAFKGRNRTCSNINNKYSLFAMINIVKSTVATKKFCKE